MNSSPIKTSAILVVALCLSATEAEACGEVMLRSLETMRYHAFVTHHPAAILLYAGDAGAKPLPAEVIKVHDGLERAGHKVSVVRGPDELATAMAKNRYDLIVAKASDLIAVTTQITKASRELTLIPVLDDAADEHQMRARYPQLVSGDLTDLLKTIERSMKALDV